MLHAFSITLDCSGHTLSSVSLQFLQSLQSCRHVLCWQSYKHFNLRTHKCRNLQPHRWETDDTAGALVWIPVPHYFYHDSPGNLKKRRSSLLLLKKARKKTSGEFQQLGWRNIFDLCNSQLLAFGKVNTEARDGKDLGI